MEKGLPIWLQFAASFATVISSLGVITALWQIIITIKQFKKQVEISNSQLEISKEQFRIENQGFITLEMKPVILLFPGEKLNEHGFYEYIRGIEMKANLSNPGKTPVKFNVDQYFIRFHDNRILNNDDYQLKGILYPNGTTTILLGSFGLTLDESPIHILDASEEQFTGLIKISYKDFINPKPKMIYREFSFNITPDMAFKSWETLIRDTI